MRQSTIALFLGLTVLGHAALARAEQEGTVQQVGYGAVSVLGTLIYMPVKTGLCIVGAVASAPVMTYDRETAGAMVGTTCGGTWVISPAIIKGREPFQFVGPS